MLFFVLLILCSLAPSLVYSQTPAESLEEYFRLDRQHNIRKYRATIDPRSNREAEVDLYFWDVTKSRLKEAGFSTHRLDPELEALSEEGRRLFRFQSGQGVGRVFAMNVPGSQAYPEFLQRLGPPSGSLKALQISGHASYRIADPDSGKIFVMKVTRKFGEDEEGRIDQVNSWSFNRSGLYLSASLRRLEEHIGSRTHFPEVAQVHVNDVRHDEHLESFLIRDVSAVSDELKPGERIVPAQALLDQSSGLLNEFAEKVGVSTEYWIRHHYLPELASFMGFMHFQLGFFHASHTQNLNVVIDSESGKIKTFVLRDMQDAYIFDLVRHHQVWTQEVWGEKLDLIYAHPVSWHRFYDPRKYFDETKAHTPGPYVSEYLAQAFSFFAEDLDVAGAYAEIFLYEYIKSVERETGLTLKLNPGAEEALSELGRGSIPSQSLIMGYSAMIVDSIAFHFIQNYFLKSESSPDFAYDQLRLMKTFVSGQERGKMMRLPVMSQVTLDSRDRPEDFIYGVNRHLLYRLHIETAEVDSYMPDIFLPSFGAARLGLARSHRPINRAIDPVTTLELLDSSISNSLYGVLNAGDFIRALGPGGEPRLGVIGRQLALLNSRGVKPLMVTSPVDDETLDAITDCRTAIMRTKKEWEDVKRRLQ